jgi:lysozyme
MQISTTGLHEIEDSEGFSSRPYLDRIASPAVWTIGFGETDGIRSNTTPITRAEGERRLKARFIKDYAWALKPFEKLSGFNQNMYDAMASFIWNCGTGAVSTDTKVGRALRARQWSKIPSLLREWVKAGGRVIPGLVNRRNKEISLFRKAVTALVRPIKLGKTEKEIVAELFSERRSAKRHGGWDKIDPSHLQNANKLKAWLLEHAESLSDQKGVSDRAYVNRKAAWLRSVANDHTRMS